MIVIGTVLKTTAKAILLAPEGVFGPKYWVPRSVVAGGDEVFAGTNIELDIADWFAEKEGLSEYSDDNSGDHDDDFASDRWDQ
jgi:hypothetical protein